MNKSESIGKLAEALAKAQGVIEGAKKDSANPFFKSKYADLASVWEVIRKPLADNGLAVIQTSIPDAEHDIVAIETTLVHSSGEWVSGVMAVKLAKTDPQALGSCVSYLRRYSISALLGVYQEDDDAEATVREKPQKTAMKEFAKKNKEADVPADLGDSLLADFINSTDEDQKKTLTVMAAARKYTPKQPIIEMEEVETRVNFFRYLTKKG